MKEMLSLIQLGGSHLEEHRLPPDAVEALEDLAPCGALLHSAFEIALAHARAYSRKEGSTNPWLYADLVRNKALGYLTEHAAEYGIGVEQLPNAGIRLTVKHRYFWVRKAGNEEREPGPYVEYAQLTLPGFELLGFVRKPNMVLLWVVDAMRDFAGFELARPLSNGKMVWKLPVPQPMSPTARVVAATDAHPIQSREEDLTRCTGEAAAEETTTASGAQTLWSTLLVSGQHAHEFG
jgi:hypothetical protein